MLLRRVAACLLAVVMVAACGSSGTPSPSPVPSPSESAPTPTAEPTPTPIPTPTPTPTPAPKIWVWTARAVDVLEEPAGKAAVQVHLGPNFSVRLTSKTSAEGGVSYVECDWRTIMRTGTGWIPADAVASEASDVMPSAGIDALDAGLYEYLHKLGNRVGVHVYDVTRETTYSYNATKGFAAASSTKVAIMLTFLNFVEGRKREPTAHELALLTSMIERSNNDSADTLYIQIGGPKPIATYLKKIGVTGITVTPNDVPWGYTSISPVGMVALLDKLRTGGAVNKTHTALALRLMSRVTRGQQIGVGDTRPKGSSVAMKDGWYAFGGQYGTVMNSSGIVTLGNEVYIISVYTDKNHGANEGFIIARKVCSTIGKAMTDPVLPLIGQP